MEVPNWRVAILLGLGICIRTSCWVYINNLVYNSMCYSNECNYDHDCDISDKRVINKLYFETNIVFGMIRITMLLPLSTNKLYKSRETYPIRDIGTKHHELTYVYQLEYRGIRIIHSLERFLKHNRVRFSTNGWKLSWEPNEWNT